MLLGRSNANRGRGQSPNRSRGSRGRGSTSRGASNSSSSESSATNPTNPFDRERAENAAKREQRGQIGIMANGKGSRGGSRGASKQVRFSDQQNGGSFSREASPATSSPFGNVNVTPANPFGALVPAPSAFNTTPSPAPYNPFGAAAPAVITNSSGTTTSSASYNPFGAAPSAKPFGASNPSSPFNPFGTAPPTNLVGTPTSSVLSNPFNTTPKEPSPSNLFGAPSGSTSIFGAPSTSGTSTPSALSNPFNTPFKEPSSSNPLGTPSTNTSTLGAPSTFAPSKPSPVLKERPPVVKQQKQKQNHQQEKIQSTNDAPIQQLLKSQGIIPPSWPKDPGNPKQRSAMESTYHAHKGYQAKARTFLMQEGKLDDPDKPKLLSEAINFKGTCEEMCPEFEKITRIVEHDVPNAEKEDAPDGSRWPAPNKMIKALARSAAGQDAPLPEEVRTPAALRRTFDYLIHSVLGDNGNLRKEHGYIWNRTRAIRRDFVFQESSMNSADLLDLVYCLEGITRFHVVALHQMSKVPEDGIAAEDFSEQQEVEQLGKALLSLVQTYDDCKERGIACENEAEFRAYYILINSRNPAVLEHVQDWGMKFWWSEDIRIALLLEETLQNTWDARGPLKPHSATEMAWNAYSRFFSIVKENSVSYTMACFAEIFFNDVRKAALKTILSSYRKQRDQTKDWTLSRLNEYLEFDNEEDIVPFGEAYGLRFDEIDDEPYLSFESMDQISDPFPPLKQPHSKSLVEYKRGDYTIPEAIDMTIYYDGKEDDEMSNVNGQIDGDEGTEEEEMFVTETVKSRNLTHTVGEEIGDDVPVDESVPTQQNTSAGRSLFNHVTTPSGKSIPASTPDLAQKQITTFARTPPEQVPSLSSSTSISDQTLASASRSFSDIFAKPALPTPAAQQDLTSLFNPKSATEAPWKPGQTISSQATSNQATPTRSFTSPSVSQPVDTAPLLPSTLGQHAGPHVAIEGPHPRPIFESHRVDAPIVTESAKPLPMFGGHNLEVPVVNESSTPPAIFGAHRVEAPPTPPPTLPVSQSPLQSASGNDIIPSASGRILSGNSLLPTPQVPPFGLAVTNPISSKFNMDTFSKWVSIGNGGIIDQFTEFLVGDILQQTFVTFQKAEKKRKAKEAADQARKEADHFRYVSLATKYVQKWRENARLLWMKRQGRRARKARQEMAEASFRASQAVKSADIVEDFRASTGKKRRSMEIEDTEVNNLPNKKRRSVDEKEMATSASKKRRSLELEESNTDPSATKKRRSSLESLLHATGVLDGVHNLDDHIRRIVREEIPEAAKRRQKSSRSTHSPSSNTCKNRSGQLDDPLRRSLLSDPSYLSGESRIHLMENYSIFDERRRQTSGVQTDYFRLKARGITTLPNGSALASSVAKNMLHHKRSFDGISKPTTPKMSKPPPVARSVPAKLARQPEFLKSSAECDEDIQVLKARAKALMAEANEARVKKRSLDFAEDEEALFAKARKIREQMDADTEWFRKERERQSSELS